MFNDNIYERLQQLINSIEANDPALATELESIRHNTAIPNAARSLQPLPAGTDTITESVFVADDTEAVILRTGRPVLTIFHNEAQLTISDPDSEVWRERISKANNLLTAAIPSVGRVNVLHHPFLDWAGTGWLIDENIIVTNRHVAELFAKADGASFVFRQSPTGSAMGSAVDLLQEYNNPQQWLFTVHKIMYIEPDPGPDMAFLLVERSKGQEPAPLVLSKGSITADSNVAVIGYPSKDSRMPDLALMERIFGQVYDKKRLAPGKITQVLADRLFHDCSTLGGCSGGAVIDLATGNIAGLHFAGRFLEANYAVPAHLVAQGLDKAKQSR